MKKSRDVERFKKLDVEHQKLIKIERIRLQNEGIKKKLQNEAKVLELKEKEMNFPKIFAIYGDI